MARIRWSHAGQTERPQSTVRRSGSRWMQTLANEPRTRPSAVAQAGNSQGGMIRDHS
jgi:hypothetical protein